MPNNLTKTYLYVNRQYLEVSMKNSVYDLAVSDDTLFLPDFRNNKVELVNLRAGNLESSFQVQMPHGITITERNIYICTHRENSIVVKQSDHEWSRQSSYLDHPISIVAFEDYMVVANWGAGSAGNLLLTDANLTRFSQFTDAWTNSKPHAVRANQRAEVIVVFRSRPGLVIFNSNGAVVEEREFSADFDPLSIVEYKSFYLIPNGGDGDIYIFDHALNYLASLYGGGHGPTNLTIWNNLLLVSEESANRILAIDLKEIDKLLNEI